MNIHDTRVAWFLARASILRGSKAVSTLTPFVIALALINLIFFFSLFNGIIKAVDELIVNTLFANILVEPAQDKPYIISADAKVNLINSISGVAAAAPHYKNSAVVSFDPDRDQRNVKSARYPVISIEPEREVSVTKIHDYVIEGRYLSEEDRDRILIGVEVAGGPQSIFPKISLGGVKVGDRVRAVYANGIAREYTVAGIYKTGSDVVDGQIFVTHKEMETVLGVRDMASEIMVKTEEAGTESGLVDTMRKRGIVQEKISIWTEFLNYTATMKRSFNFLSFVTGIVGMIVVNVTVFIVIFINVVNKRKQLGILRAMGIEERIITASYIFQTLMYCLAGILGSVLIMFGILVPYFSANPLDIGFGPFSLIVMKNDVVLSVGVILITNMIAGFIPTVWAIRRETIIKSIWGV